MSPMIDRRKHNPGMQNSVSALDLPPAPFWLGTVSGENAECSFGGAVLRGVEGGRVRRLGGFRKGAHRVPDGHSAATESFVRKVGAIDVETRAEDLFRQMRLAFGWKRQDLECSVEAGFALVRTPDFSVQLWVDQDPADPRCFLRTLEVRDFRRPEVVDDDGFLAFFRLRCDTVMIEFPGTIEVASRIDAAEDSERLRPLLGYPSDASWMTLKPEGGSGVEMRLEAHCATFRMPRGGDLGALIEGTRRLLAACQSAGARFYQGALR